MPKPLTAIAIAALKPKLKPKPMRREVPDPGCPGLKITIFPTGKKSFVVRYRYGGVQKKLTLGSVLVAGVAESDTAPELDTPLSLAAAREMATKALREAKSGTDPSAAKQKRHQEQVAAESETLLATSDKYLRQEGKKLRTVKQRAADLKLVTDVLGRLPVADIKRSQFKHLFDVIAETRGEVRADRVLSATKRLLSWYASNADEYVPVLVPVRRRTSITERARKRVLSDEELAAVWLAAEQDQGPYGAWIRFTLLTAARRDESGGLRRSELIDGGTCWLLPAARCKSERDVLIPLSKAAQKIVESMPVLAGGDPYVFSVNGSMPLGSFGDRKVKFDKLCGVTGWVQHDLRRTARTLLSKCAGVTPDIAERCLGHAISGMRGTYDHHDYLDEKRHAFDKLAALIELIVHPSANVVPMTKAKARRK